MTIDEIRDALSNHQNWSEPSTVYKVYYQLTGHSVTAAEFFDEEEVIQFFEELEKDGQVIRWFNIQQETVVDIMSEG